MARTIYEKPTRALLRDMLEDLGLKPGQVFTTGRAIQWFAEHYPRPAASARIWCRHRPTTAAD